MLAAVYEDERGLWYIVFERTLVGKYEANVWNVQGDYAMLQKVEMMESVRR